MLYPIASSFRGEESSPELRGGDLLRLRLVWLTGQYRGAEKNSKQNKHIKNQRGGGSQHQDFRAPCLHMGGGGGPSPPLFPKEQSAPAKRLLVGAAQHINFISPQNAENGDPKIRNRDGLGNSEKFRFSVEFPQKPSVRGTPGNSFWGPHFGILGGFLGEMRMRNKIVGNSIQDGPTSALQLLSTSARINAGAVINCGDS